MKSLLTLLLPLLFLGLAQPVSAQFGEASGTLYVRAEGDDLRAAIVIEVSPQWHLYHTEVGGDIDEYGDGYPAKPLIIEPRGDGVTWSGPRVPEPERYSDKALDNWAFVHHGTVTIWLRGRLEGGDAAQVEVAVDGLTCTSVDGRCIPYAETLKPRGPGSDALFADFPADLEMGGGSAAERFVQADFPPVEEFETSASPLSQAAAKLYTRVEGSDVRAVIEIDVDFQWHLYHSEVGGDIDEYGDGYPAKPLLIEMLGGGARWSAPVLPEPERYVDEALDNWAWVHHGTVRIYLRGELAPGVDGSNVGVSLDGLTCTSVDGRCVPFQATLATSGPGRDAAFADFPAGLAVGETVDAGGTGAVEPAPVEPAVTDGRSWDEYTFEAYTPREDESQRSIGLWLLLAFIAGAILNVMPCVLPVVSIKILSFVQQAGESRSRIFALGLAFAGGIMVVFLGLASLAAFAEQGWGEQFQSPTFLVVMIGIVFAFSLSMFDVFELGVPKKVTELAGAPPREGLVDAFFKGMMATVLATPCSGPFLGSTLAWALAQEPLTIFLIFTMIGLGMAMPYVLLTANPAALKIVPKPGPWMATFKHAMGFVLLATVVYLMVSLNQELLLFTIAFLVFVGMGCWYWGRFATFDQTTVKRFVTLGIAAGIVALGARIAFVDFRGLFEVHEGQMVWEDFDPAKLEQYHGEGRHVFMDFTADWCPNCKVNERFVFESEEVRAAMEKKGVIAVKADITRTDERTAAIVRLRDQLGSRSIPFCAVFPAGDPYNPIIRRDLVTVGEMKTIFDALPVPDKIGAR